MKGRAAMLSDTTARMPADTSAAIRPNCTASPMPMKANSPPGASSKPVSTLAPHGTPNTRQSGASSTALTTIIARDPTRFGYPAPDRGLRRFAYDSVRVDLATPLSVLAQVGNLPLGELQELNPHMLRQVAPRNYWVWVPLGQGAPLQQAFLASEFRQRVANGEALEDILFEAYAAVREAFKRSMDGVRLFDVQMMGGIVLHEGDIAEMKTGEGKTFVATQPLYLNALTGRGTHLVTVNDYLAQRDQAWTEPVFQALGMRPGYIYRLRLDVGGVALYPTFEIHGALQLNPKLCCHDFPVPVNLSADDITTGFMVQLRQCFADGEEASFSKARLPMG